LYARELGVRISGTGAALGERLAGTNICVAAAAAARPVLDLRSRDAMSRQRGCCTWLNPPGLCDWY
jgi:hypothetical protein